MSKPSFVYVVYIASTAEKVFAALTDPDMTARYWTGSRVESDWKVGSPFELELTRHDKNITGQVLEYDPPRRLAYTFHAHHDGMESEGPSRVTFELEQQKGQVKLTLVHDDFEPGSQVFESVSRGWPLVISGLKSLMETGRVDLRAPWYDEQDAAGAAA
jgi:uncharacterized protein YndB with AHSA1/START domain